MKCAICGKNHQRVIRERRKICGEMIEVNVIKSPCLDRISKKAVNLVNAVIKNK